MIQRSFFVMKFLLRLYEPTLNWALNHRKTVIGMAMMILSTETNPVVAERARKLKLPVLHGVADKASVLAADLARRGLEAARVLYVGNDTNDLAAMRLVGWTAAPADAHPSVRAIATVVTAAAGGAGVIRELADMLLGDPE